MTKEEQVLERIEQRAAFIQNCANREGTCRSCDDALAMIRIHVNELRALVAEGAGGGAPPNLRHRAEQFLRDVSAPLGSTPETRAYSYAETLDVMEHFAASVAGGGAAPHWQPIETYSDNGEVVIAWNEQPYKGYYQDPDGWFADVDGELLRIYPPPTHWCPLPPSSTREE